FGLGEVGYELRSWRQPGLGAAVCLRNLGEQITGAASDLRGIGAHLSQHFRNDAFTLFGEGDEQVLGLELSVAHLGGELLRRDNRFLSFLGVLVDIHTCLLGIHHEVTKSTTTSTVSRSSCLREKRLLKTTW